MTTPAIENRHYYRCHDCLDVWVVGIRTDAPCPTCGGPTHYMGAPRARSAGLFTEKLICTCNELCQTARGPHCNCNCGGRNHGIGLVRAVVRTEDETPRLAPATKGKAHRLCERALEFRTARREARAQIDRVFGRIQHRKMSGCYLVGYEWTRYCEATRWEDAYREAANGLVQASRVARFRHIVTELGQMDSDPRGGE